MNSRKLFLTTFLGSLFFFFLLHNFFSIKVIRVEGVEHLEDIQVYGGEFLPTFSEFNLLDNMYEKNPAISITGYGKEYPHTLLITARQDKPIVYIPVSGGYFVVSDARRVIAKVQNEDQVETENVHRLTYYQKFNMEEYQIGDKLDKNDINAAIDFISYIKKLGIEIQTIDIAGPHMIVLNSDDRRYIISAEDGEIDIGVQARDLDYILQRLTRKGQDYKQIDLRFEKPIVTF